MDLVEQQNRLDQSNPPDPKIRVVESAKLIPISRLRTDAIRFPAFARMLLHLDPCLFALPFLFELGFFGNVVVCEHRKGTLDALRRRMDISL